MVINGRNKRIGLPAALLSREHQNVCALSGLMRDPVSWNHLDTLSSCCTASAASWQSFYVLYMSASSASVRILLGPIWFRSARHLVYTLKKADESGDPCGRPTVSRWGAELQFPSCITTVLSRSAPALLLTQYCMSRSISSLNWTLLYASPRSIATATVCSFLWSPSYTLCANAATFSHVHFLGLNPLICREYIPVLEVSGEFPGNNAFHELPNSVLRMLLLNNSVTC